MKRIITLLVLATMVLAFAATAQEKTGGLKKRLAVMDFEDKTGHGGWHIHENQSTVAWMSHRVSGVALADSHGARSNEAPQAIFEPRAERRLPVRRGQAGRDVT